MSVRWTRRPHNLCRRCGYSWYPRGKNVSAQCPRCGSEAVELPIEALFRAIGYLFAAIFVAIAFVAVGLFRLVAFLARTAFHLASAFAESEFGKTLGRGFLFPFKWLSSVKDDLKFEEDRQVNPIALIAKLLVAGAISVCAIVFIVNMFRAGTASAENQAANESN